MQRITLTTMALVLMAAWHPVVLAADAGVARAAFTTAIENREPVDSVDELGTDQRRVLFFTELRDLEGRTVTHRWLRDHAVVTEVEFDVGGPRWRVWSSKDLLPDWAGEWTVEVIDDAGGYHGSWSFVYSADAAMSSSGGTMTGETADDSGMTDEGTEGTMSDDGG